MPNSVSKRSSRIALLAVLAVIASLFALPVAPAGATNGTADDKPVFTACPSDVIPDAGFSDTASSFATDQIDCIAYYGITQGAGSGATYNPSGPVLRWHMALFLKRAAGPAGVTVPAASDQGFSDIGDLPQATQDAINQIAALGWTQGKGSATTFAPTDPVTRQQMALFLARFLDDVTVGPGGVDIDDVDADDTVFTDIGQVSVEMYDAIRDLYELGVTEGTTATTFGPTQVVSRAQMAAFVKRSLDHSNARPAGISFQAVPSAILDGDDVDVAISLRDSDFMPLANELVDVFDADLDDKADAVDSDGTCDTDFVDATFGGSVCEIDAADPDTDTNGNIEVTVSPSDSVIWWAWTGDTGDDFDLDTTDVAAAEVTVGAAPDDWLITDNVSEFTTHIDADSEGNLGWDDGAGVKYGTTVTLTFQLVDLDDDPVALAGEEIELGFYRYVNDAYKGDTIVLLESDANGTATYSWTESDPSSDDDPGDATLVGWYINDDPSGFGWDDDTVNPGGDEEYVWEDADSEAANVEASVATVEYTTGSNLVVRGTVYDQYGLTKSGEDVEFVTNVNDDDVAVERTTNSSGVASQTIAKDADLTSYREDVQLTLQPAVDTTNIFVYFGETGDADGSIANAQPIAIADTANNKLVVGPIVTAAEFGAAIDGVAVLTYKDTDFFTYNGDAMLVDDFEDMVDDGDTLAAVNYDPDGVSVWTINP